MARTTPTPVVLTPNSTSTTIASIATSTVSGVGSPNGVLVTNTGASVLVVVSTGTTTTLTVLVGTTVLGQAAASFSVVLPSVAGTYIVGPFNSAVNQPGLGVVAVDFSSITGITVGVMQLPGVV